ncbi:SAM-dependent methyltransferase, partial [Streptomyces sp. T-3]|nr:SAM-dependent methyltransferase [Streptomyces sp. T-3]
MTTTSTDSDTGTESHSSAGTRPRELRDFYEDPAVPVASGDARSLRQARMLADAIGPATSTPRVVLDVGCGDGTAA